MTLFPKHPLSRCAAALWLLACLTFLLLTLLQRDALAMLVPVYFLAFPSGHIAVLAISKIKLTLYLNSGFEPSVLSECIYLWTFMVVLGYVQWRLLLPWVSRGWLQRRNTGASLELAPDSHRTCRTPAQC